MSINAIFDRPGKAPPRLADSRLHELIELACDWYWEQDAEFRFTCLEGKSAAAGEWRDAQHCLGKRFWEIGLDTDGGWDAHRAQLVSRSLFRDLIVQRALSDGTRRYFSISGAPVFDERGQFVGYRGVGRDITERQQHAAEVLQFRTAIESSPDPIYIVDPQAMRFLYVNETACRLAGVTPHEYLQLSPMDVTRLKREELERIYADAIAKGDAGLTSEYIGVSKDGRRGWFEGHRRAVRIGDRWVIVIVSREVTQRKLVENAAARRSRIHAVLGAANETMLRAKSADELYRELCEAAVREGKFVSAAVLRPAANGVDVEIAAVHGVHREALRGMRISLDAGIPAGQGLVGTAYRTREPCVSNDFLDDRSTQAWHQFARDLGVRASAAFPLMRNGHVSGILLIGSAERQEFDEEAVALLQRMTENLPLALDNIEREEALLRFRAAMDASPDLIFVIDPDAMRILYVNETACRLSGYTREEYDALGPVGINHGLDENALRRTYEEAIAKGDAGTTLEYVMPSKDGRRGWMESHRRAVRVGDKWLIVTISREVTQRKLAEKAAQQMSRMYAALGATNEAILRANSPQELYQQVCDAAVNGGEFIISAILRPDPNTNQATIVAIAGAAERAMRAARISVDPSTPEGRGLVGTAFRTLKPCVSNDYLADERTAIWHEHSRKIGIRSAAAVPLIRGDVAVGVLLFHSSERRSFDDEIVKLLERMARNIAFALDNFEREAQRARAEERVQYLAMHDGLSGLPNRVMFGQLLSHTIESSRRYQHQFAVLFIDLDRFKVINDSLGHEAGDQLLQEVARRLKQSLRASDIVARFGGDEFVVLLPQINGTSEAAAVARKALAAVLAPMTIGGQECRVTASIGVAMYPADGDDEQSLMKNADIAMYLAKDEGKNNYQFYSKDARTQTLAQLTLETALRRALERDEFSLHYQAKLNLQTGAITGVEALLRWHSPELGSISPAQFIPLAEETGMIVPIGRWVMNRACAQNMAWQRDGLPPVCLAVNLSVRQFADPDLLSDIAAALKAAGMPPELLELELTEGMVTQNADRAIKLLTAIKRMGVQLAIDDFGTGYSSLGQLKRFPIDTLKIDRSFIRDIPHDAEDKAITEAIIALGAALDLNIVAEGVETAEQMDFLRSRACDEIQGFYFSKPVPAEAFAHLLRGHIPHRK